MAIVPTHAFVGLAVADVAAGRHAGTRIRVAGAVCAALPDLDVLLMRFGGVAYEDAWGHRGILHGLPLAVLLGTVVALLFFRNRSLPWWRAALALVFATSTQGLLDAMTTGGLGVAFFAPFDLDRFFLPWTPIPVAPLSVGAFFTENGARILAWELVHLWVPVGAVLLGVHAVRRARRQARGGAGRELPPLPSSESRVPRGRDGDAD